MEAAEERLLREHLPYELDMLEWAYAFLHADRFAMHRLDAGARNAAIECFWTHARNLYEFMTRKGKKSAQGVASASDFVEAPFHPDLPFDQIDEKMNIQIAHLQYDRPPSNDGKLGGYEMGRFKEALSRAIKLFESKMTQDARGIWKIRQPIVDVYLHDIPASATNSIQTSTTKTSISSTHNK